MMTLSMFVAAAVGMATGSLAWDTLPVLGADVPRINALENLRKIERLF